jgi:hypothetical protein
VANFKYVGRYPDSAAVLATKAYADADNNANLVTTTWIDQQIAAQSAGLVSQAYITQHVAAYATQSQVVAANAAYVPLTQLGANSGIAKAAADLSIPSGQLPTLITNRQAIAYDLNSTGAQNLIGSNSYTCTTTNLQEKILASIPIPDPGYPWYPMPFAAITGQTASNPSGSRFVGNGVFGLLTVMPPSGISNLVYGTGIAADDSITNWYELIPYGAGTTTPAPMTPANRPPIIGPLTLNLGCCCWSGSGYTFNGTGMQYWILVLPALGNGVKYPH